MAWAYVVQAEDKVAQSNEDVRVQTGLVDKYDQISGKHATPTHILAHTHARAHTPQPR